MIRYPRKSWRKVCLCHQKNSIRWIGKLLDSVWDLVDKIFILDHLSTDGTFEYLKELQKRYPSKIQVVQWKDPEFNEKVLRTQTWIQGLSFVGYPDWVIFLDGDESLSESLRSFLKEEFSKPSGKISWRVLESGIQHLYRDEGHQIINRRSGTVERIWNTFSLRDFGFETLDSLKTLHFVNTMGKEESYPFHIAVVPEEVRRKKRSINPGSYRKKVLFPLNHWGYFDEEMAQRKLEHYRQIPYPPEKSILEKVPVILDSEIQVDWSQINPEELEKRLRPSPVGRIKRSDFEGNSDEITRVRKELEEKALFVPGSSDLWMFIGWDEGYLCEKFIQEFQLKSEQCWLFRSPVFPWLAFVDQNRILRRNRFQWTSFSGDIFSRARWIVVSDSKLLEELVLRKRYLSSDFESKIFIFVEDFERLMWHEIG